MIQFTETTPINDVEPIDPVEGTDELDQVVLEQAAEEASPAPVAQQSEPEQDDEDDAEPTVSDADLDIEDSTRLYLREIARVPLLTAQEEVVLAKAIELGARIQTDPWTAVLDLHEWTRDETEPVARAKHPAYALPQGEEAHRIVRSAIEDESAGELLLTAPRFGFTEAIRDAQGTPAADLLERARALRAV